MLHQHQGNYQLAHGYSVLCLGKLYKIPMHYTTNNSKNVSVLVRRFLKMCDADEYLPISCINPVTITLSVGVRVIKMSVVLSGYELSKRQSGIFQPIG